MQIVIRSLLAIILFMCVGAVYSISILKRDTVPETVITDSLVFTLEEVVVLAFNRSQSLVETPGSLSYLGNLLLERNRPTYNILPVFQYAPGIFAHSGATNTSRLTIRGIGARVPYATGKIRAYFNNIPLTNASGVTFVEDIDPSVIESMEIIKGPATSVYGAGLGGTITMTARRPAARKSGFSNMLQAGSFGLLRNTAMVDLVGGNQATSLVYSHTQSDGYRQNNNFRRDAITSMSQFSSGERTQFTTLFAFSDLKSYIPSSIDSITYFRNPEAASANWLKTKGYEDSRRLLGGITANHQFAPSFAADFGVFSVWHDEKEMRPFDVFYEERFTLGSRFKASYEWQSESIFAAFTAGGEVFTEKYLYSNYQNIAGEGVQGDLISDNKEDVFVYNVFMQTDATLGRWRFSAGINLNQNQREYHDLFRQGIDDRSGRYDYGMIVSPRFSAGYTFFPDNAVYTSISHGFSPPSLAETLTPEGFVNMDIRPEKSWSIEAGLRGKLIGSRLFYDLSFYHMLVQDLLVAERVGEDAWVGKNAGESVHQGLEAEAHFVVYRNAILGKTSLHELSLRTNYTLNNFRFTDFTDRENDFTGNAIPGIPRQVFFMSVYGELGWGLYGLAGYRFVGSMFMNDGNTRKTEPYNLMDVKLGFKRDFGLRWNADLFLSVNNLFNEKYASMILVNAPSFGNTPPRYYYPGLPVNFSVGVLVGIR